MNPQQDEDNAAFFSRNDRFDGFDRGDLDRDHDADQNSINAAIVCDEMRAEIAELDAKQAPRFSFVAYTTPDFGPVHLDRAGNVYRVWGDEIAFFPDPAQARRVAKHFSAGKVPCSSAPFAAWKAARIDYLKGMIDRLSQV